MAIAYAVTLLLSAALLVLYCTLIREKHFWMILLYACICVANLGYLLLACAKTLAFALFVNKIVYLGHIFLLISMYLSILRLCGFVHKRRMPVLLCSLGTLVFAVVCTTGYLPWYYTAVRLEFADGAAKLVKEYGPLHAVYLAYVLVYFAMMIATIVCSIHRKKVASRKEAGLLTAIVLCNIVMWLIEKAVTWNFEFLSVSYVLSACMMFFLSWLLQDLRQREQEGGEHTRIIVLDSIPRAEKMERVLSTLPEKTELTTRQLEMLEGVLDGKTYKEMAAELHISENTVKWHLKLLYETLGVGGKDEILRRLK